MKLNGKKISGPNIEIIVLPRGDGEDIVLKAQAVLNKEDFEQLCPLPKPPVKMLRGGNLVNDVEDKNYQTTLMNYNKMYMDWLIIQSLKATEDLEWETVEYNNPSTWSNYKKELTEAGFSDAEHMRILNSVMTANALNEVKIEEARRRFFTMDRLKKQDQLSPEDELANTLSGVLANE